MNRAGAAVLCALLVNAPVQAFGAGPPHVAFISIPACDAVPFSLAAFRSLLAIELANDGFERVEIGQTSETPSGSGVVTGALEIPGCSADSSVVRLRVSESLAGTALEREIQLADVQPPDRARVVAIAMAESIRGWERPSRATTAAQVTTVPPSAVQRSAPALRSGPQPTNGPRPLLESAEQADDYRLGLAMEQRWLQASTLLTGIRAVGFLPLVRRGAWMSVDTGWQQANVESQLGDVGIRYLTGSLGLLVGSTGGTLLLRAGPRIELGYAHVEGHRANSNIHQGSGGGAVIVGSLTAALLGQVWKSWDILVQAEVGWAPQGVAAEVQGQSLFNLQGPQMALRIGLAARVKR